MYNNYYAPYQRQIQPQIGYYNPSIPNVQDPQSYQPVAQTNTAQQSQIVPQNSSDMIWVLNETEAISYPVALNNSVTLWDKNNDTVYIKSVNMQGVPSIRILDYKERTVDNSTKMNQCSFDGSKFVSADDFKALQSKFDGLQSELNELKAKSKAKPQKKDISDDE